VQAFHVAEIIVDRSAMSHHLLLRRLRRDAGVKAPDQPEDMVPVIPSPQPADELPEHNDDEYEYYYYYDVDVTTETASGEKENPVKKLAKKIGDTMHGRSK